MEELRLVDYLRDLVKTCFADCKAHNKNSPGNCCCAANYWPTFRFPSELKLTSEPSVTSENTSPNARCRSFTIILLKAENLKSIMSTKRKQFTPKAFKDDEAINSDYDGLHKEQEVQGKKRFVHRTTTLYFTNDFLITNTSALN
ncbi:hypothetical protein WUBG_11172 [Wuchereria bancrofti]|uniref:Uncharacterized protein n=1 Tax=Wuchereria bancrofti TaxID=6293 RepID=J9ATX6_WUCBA|nr:hypothetical protein WUBG_11172 [Wuchereria bancrofti]